MSNVTITRPKCRIRGCPRPMQTRKLGLCNMHRARFLRTGKVGPAGEISGSKQNSERPARTSKMARELADIVNRHGPTFRLWWSGPGSYEIRDMANKHPARSYAIPLILSLVRREWIRLDTKDQLVKHGKLTTKGNAALGEL